MTFLVRDLRIAAVPSAQYGLELAAFPNLEAALTAPCCPIKNLGTPVLHVFDGCRSFEFNATGAVVWELLAKPRQVTQIAQHLATVFPWHTSEMEGHAAAIVAQLAGDALVIRLID